MPRLIDADALIYDLEIVPLTGDGGVDINDLEDIVKRQPTIEERKTGRWIHHDDKAYAGGGYEECSCCKWRCSEWIFIEDSHYCPNCGCRMMEVEHERHDIPR